MIDKKKDEKDIDWDAVEDLESKITVFTKKGK